MKREVKQYAFKKAGDVCLTLIRFSDHSVQYAAMLSNPVPDELFRLYFRSASRVYWSHFSGHDLEVAARAAVLSVDELLWLHAATLGYQFKISVILGNNQEYHIDTMYTPSKAMDRIMCHGALDDNTRLGVEVLDASGQVICKISSKYP